MFALLKQVRTPPVRPADGVVECVYESFVPGEDYRGLGLRGRTLSRPLSASVCGKYVVAATRLSPFKVGDNQRPERTMSGAAKTSAYFPLHAQPPTGTKESASPLTTPDMVRSGRVLQTSVKFPIPHNFSSESDKTAPAFHSPPRSATEAALSGLRSGL